MKIVARLRRRPPDGHPQGFGPEAYLDDTSQGTDPEDARPVAWFRDRSRSFMNGPGQIRYNGPNCPEESDP